jgi:SAM-dependent methyltransferase
MSAAEPVLSGAALSLVIARARGRALRVLDIGCGSGVHAAAMRDAGLRVTTLDALGDLEPRPDIVGDYLAIEMTEPFDVVWASHVLEHQRNVGLFLDKVFRDTREGGLVAVTVPPLKHEIVGGHLTLWNAGLLLYNLVLAGFDCREASVKEYGYNISVVLEKQPAALPPLASGEPDIERLAPFFPVPVWHGFHGRLEAVRWP